MANPDRTIAQSAAIFDTDLSAIVAQLGLVGPPVHRELSNHTKSALRHLLVEHLGDDVERWTELIKHFDNLPGPAQTEFLGRLNEFACEALDENTRCGISESIREKVSEHRRFAMPRVGFARARPFGA